MATKIDSIIDQSCPELIRKNITIYSNDNELYTCTLNQADIVNNCNKFMIIQLLARKDKNAYFIVSRAGRVGYKGSNNIDCFLSETMAVNEFFRLFREKTGFSWDDRAESDQMPGKYDYIEMKHQDKQEIIDEITEEALKIKLDEKVIKLMEMIFDQKLFDDMAREFNLDLERAPLGAISSTQIQKAYRVLDKINKELTKDDPDAKIITELSSSFYTVIPTYTKMVVPPPLNNESILKEKVELLKILGDVEVMAKIIKRTSGAMKLAEKQYFSLNCEIEPVVDSSERAMLNQFMENTKGKHYNPKIIQAYKVARIEEKTRFMKWKNMHNRQLLWHGSGRVNYVGILSTGLRINPGNVVKAGSMFGNGLYFANCSTKSAQYMRVSHGQVGIMLLCEVALGNCYQRYSADYIYKLPDNYHSTWGIGCVTPDVTKQKVLSDGTIVPMGPLITNTGQTGSLQYDEFIVYDQSQVRIKYLFMVKI